MWCKLTKENASPCSDKEVTITLWQHLAAISYGTAAVEPSFTSPTLFS